MRRTSGSVQFGGSVAYCPQTAWIQNATVRENICFGRPFDEERYWRAIRDSCLERDLELLPHYDMTEVGEKGTHLCSLWIYSLTFPKAFLYLVARNKGSTSVVRYTVTRTSRFLTTHCLLWMRMSGRRSSNECCKTTKIERHGFSSLTPCTSFLMSTTCT